MKKLLGLALFFVLLLSACAAPQEAAATWEEQYDLGVRYLSEGNYEEAIIAFNAAIEIDPKRAEAYLSLADAYVATGDTEKALEVLSTAPADVEGRDRLLSRLQELSEPEEEPAPAPASSHPHGDETEIDPETGWTREIFYQEDGSWSVVEYDENDVRRRTIYHRTDGTEYVSELGEDGQVLRTLVYGANGSLESYQIPEYDENGVRRKISFYHADGSIWHISDFDAAGVERRSSWYYDDGSLRQVVECDEIGTPRKTTNYNADGSIDWVREYDTDGSESN